MRRSERNTQELAKKGKLKTKPHPDYPNARLYDPESVKRYILPEQKPPSPEAIRRRENRERQKARTAPETAIARRSDADVVMKEMAGAFREMIDKFFTEHKAMREAEQHRLDAERKMQQERLDEEKRRWETEQADKKRQWEIEREAQELRRKDWLTPQECFRGWGMPARMAVERAEKGELVAYRHGKSWRIQRRSLEALGGATHTPERALAAVK